MASRNALIFASLAIVTLGSAAACQQSSLSGPRSIDRRTYGETSNGEAVDLYTMGNANGVEVQITNYGGIVVSISAPDRSGASADIVLGHDAIEGYEKDSPYFGAIVGRYGNRIANGQFTLDGATHRLARNNGQNHLHGGLKGFDKAVWQMSEREDPNGLAVELRYRSKDGEEGYPGNVDATVTYTLTEQNELRIDYAATTDKPTVVNLTNHSYFNLAGHAQEDILGHELMIDADRFTPVDEGLIPTGELRPVDGTPFDFRTPTPIGARINEKDQQLAFGTGYDHNYVLNGKAGSLRLVAQVREPRSGRVLEVLTTEPGVQFYSGNFLDGTIRGKGAKAYGPRAGFCLETQHFPDSPNKPTFPTTLLRPGQQYWTTTVYRFSTDRSS
ncbi:MAG: galactose-1-epimerase [Luteitalea sp.]|nr:galactose-1-epimerase [Luteitalea sp.]